VINFDSNGNIITNNIFGNNNQNFLNTPVYDSQGRRVQFNDDGSIVGETNFNNNFVPTNNNNQVFYDSNGQVLNNWSWESYNTVIDTQAFVAPSICTVPIGTLESSPFNLVDGDSVYARIVCQNVIGMSLASDVENGAIIPSVPSAVSNFVCSGRTANTITLTWAEPINTGGAALTCYQIQYQKISNNNFQNEVQTQQICRNQAAINYNVVYDQFGNQITNYDPNSNVFNN
jgi:hypothetical protein